MLLKVLRLNIPKGTMHRDLLDTKETCGLLLLHAACYRLIMVVDGLLADKVDVNFQNKRGQYALWYVAFSGYT